MKQGSAIEGMAIEMMQEIADQCDGLAADLEARGLAAHAGKWREKASQARQLVARRVDERRAARAAELPQGSKP